MPTSARKILKDIFGYDAFRGDQEAVIDHVAAGGDALVLMPTGGGKSLCYQIPSLLRPGTGIVVSPLIALMQDQVSALREYGVRAAFLNSTLEFDEASRIESGLGRGEYDLVYMAPERLLVPRTLAMLRDCRLALFAIDEAHCVSQWGHDFRPEYLGLDALAGEFPGVPRVALTATADELTRGEIVRQLRMDDAEWFVSGFDRPNIRYSIHAKKSPSAQLAKFLEGRRDQCGIVYCLSRKSVEETAARLVNAGFNACPYHAGLGAEQRGRNQDRFLREEAIIVVATIAFGMGIDRPDVRFVAHMDLPKSIEAYYQETGRAGRDGLPADAWMVFGMSDVVKLRSFIDGSEADEAHKRVERGKLNALVSLCSTARCRRQALLEHFGDRHPARCDNCDVCLGGVETWDGTVAAQKAISCVARTGQRYGMTYVIDVLLGAETDERIVQNRHDALSTFGVGTEHSKAKWSSIFRQLVALGLLDVDTHGYNTLKLNAASQAVLRGERDVPFVVETELKPSKKRSKGARVAAEELSQEDFELFERLRETRAEIAARIGKPPYVVFHDATLRSMAKLRPETLEAMLEVHGVGQSKCRRYGQRFLDVLRG